MKLFFPFAYCLAYSLLFRKGYYNTQLLPALLVTRPGGEEEGRAKDSLIDLLNSRGRIPPPLYRMFTSGELGRQGPCPVSLLNSFGAL